MAVTPRSWKHASCTVTPYVWHSWLISQLRPPRRDVATIAAVVMDAIYAVAVVQARRRATSSTRCPSSQSSGHWQ